jgi:hypothetical protein
MHPISIILIFLTMQMIMMESLTFTGSPNFIKRLTRKDTLLVQKNVLQNWSQYSLEKYQLLWRRGLEFAVLLYMPEVRLFKWGF